MSMSHRLQKSRNNLNSQNRKTASSRVRLHRAEEIRLVPAKIHRGMDAEPKAEPCWLHSLEEIYLVIQRRPMRSFPMPDWVKLTLRVCYRFMRWVNRKYGFAASEESETAKSEFHSIEIRVAHPNETDAWHDANCEGGMVKRVPWKAPLPEGTCQFGVEICPAFDGETQRGYQDRKLEIVSFLRSEWESLEEKVEQVARSASA